MTTTTKIDEVRNGQHFVHLEFSTPVLKSVLTAKNTVKHSFSIDGASVDEQTFRALYAHADNRLNQLFDQSIAAMDAFKATGRVNLEALDQIEAQLTPDEQKICESHLTTFEYPGVEPPELRDFLRRVSALGATLPQCVQNRLMSLQSAETTA